MSHIVFAWELGADLGHLSGFLPLALRLRERGHRITFISRDLANVGELLVGKGFAVLQAPVWLAKSAGLPKPPLNYAEIVMHCGYHSAQALLGLASAWRGLYDMLRPDLVVCDHAPTALLAARGAGVRRAVYGLGFFSPPHTAPLPVMRPWHKPPAGRIERNERRVLDAVNAVLTAQGGTALARLADLFHVDEDFLCTFREFDHYPQRGDGAHYWGPVYNVEHGTDVAWREPAARHIFAYVKPQSRDFDKVALALRRLDAETLLFAPGLGLKRAQELATDRMRVSLVPLRLAGILKRCDLAVCHAGLGTMAAVMQHAVPVLALPMQLEQYLIGRCLETLGAGVSIKPEDAPPDYAKLLNDLLDNPAYGNAARGFAQAHADHDPDRQFTAMADRIEKIVAG